MNRYAVIDSAQRSHFHERLERLGARYRSLFEGTAEAGLLDIAPLLVAWTDRDLHAQLDAEIRQMGAQRPGVTLLWSALELDDLAKRLRAFHLVKVPEKGGREMLLRWYDTRILPALLDLLLPAQRAALLEGVQRLQYFDRYGDLQEWPLAEMLAGMDDAGLPALPPLRLDEDQYTRLLDACEPDVAIAQLRRVIPDEIKRVPYRSLYPFVVDLMQDTIAHGVNQVDDHVQYLLLALYTSGACRGHPAVQARFAQPAGSCEVPFADWASALPADIWTTGVPLWDHTASPLQAEPAPSWT